MRSVAHPRVHLDGQPIDRESRPGGGQATFAVTVPDELAAGVAVSSPEATPPTSQLLHAIGSSPATDDMDAGVDGAGAYLLTIEQAARRLNVPRSWLRDRVTARQVPHTRLGRHVRFAPGHLAQIIAAGEQCTRTEPVQVMTGRRRRRGSLG